MTASSRYRPDYFLLATGGQTRLIRYWDFDYPVADDEQPVGPDTEYAERFRHALDEAVRLRLRADVPVGCYLSGGIDSCASWAWRRSIVAIRSGLSL